MTRKSILETALLTFAVITMTSLQAQGNSLVMYEGNPCGVLDPPNQYGPYDYRTATQAQRDLVEGSHFQPLSEALVRSRFGGGKKFASDFDYTLRAFPNHPRALIAMSRISIREGTPKPNGAQWLVDCYFERGMTFQPDDHMVPLVFAHHLRQTNRPEKAKHYLAKAESLVSNKDGAAITFYNIGIQYVELGDLVNAKKMADMEAALSGEESKLTQEIQKRTK
jgi:hypothetical protein